MKKYKRFNKEITKENEIQDFLDEITTDGWEIIFYSEKDIGGMGIIRVTIVGKKIEDIKQIL